MYRCCSGDELEAEENFRTAEIGSATCFLLLTGFLLVSAVYIYRYFSFSTLLYTHYMVCFAIGYIIYYLIIIYCKRRTLSIQDRQN